MKILAIDMGRSKSVACDYVAETAEHAFQTLATEPQAFHDLIVQKRPEVVVIEICPAAGWVKDLCDALAVKLQVANTADEPWRWRKVKRKSDRDDSLKLARLEALRQLKTVHVPAQAVRQWRALIQYRQTLVADCTSIRNRIRGILDGVAIKLPSGAKAFSQTGRQEWRQSLCRELDACGMEELWRGIVQVELLRLEELEKHLQAVEQRLEQIAAADERVRKVRAVPAVGARTAELLVALIDDPARFARGKQLGNYAGFTPKKYQSGNMDRDGRISRGGSGHLRALLVQASWIGVGRLRVSWMKQLYERVGRGSQKRKKKAIVAVARHLLVRLWAMLRDGTAWQDAPVSAVM
jgi:transposase